jgi:hypothetical protein
MNEKQDLVPSTKRADAKTVTTEVATGIVKSLMGAVPFAGTLLTEAAFDVRARINQKRFEAFVGELSQTVARLGDEKISHATLESEEFSDLLVHAIEKATKTRSERKRKIFADIVADSMCRSSLRDFDQREVYTSILASLDDAEITILRSFHSFIIARKKRRTQDQELQMPSLDYTAATLFGVPTEIFRMCFETLISKGLVFDDSFGRMDTHARTFILPTPLAEGLMDFVHNVESNIES